MREGDQARKGGIGMEVQGIGRERETILKTFDGLKLVFYSYKFICIIQYCLPVCQAERPSPCFHLTDYLIH